MFLKLHDLFSIHSVNPKPNWKSVKEKTKQKAIDQQQIKLRDNVKMEREKKGKNSGQNVVTCACAICTCACVRALKVAKCFTLDLEGVRTRFFFEKAIGRLADWMEEASEQP